MTLEQFTLEDEYIQEVGLVAIPKEMKGRKMINSGECLPIVEEYSMEKVLAYVCVVQSEEELKLFSKKKMIVGKDVCFSLGAMLGEKHFNLNALSVEAKDRESIVFLPE